MGNILVDLDGMFSKFHFSYLQAFTHSQFLVASSLLYQANSSLPSGARISNMPRFEIIDRSYGSDINSNNDAQAYCDKWAPLVWGAIADYREDMLSRLDED